MTRTLVVTALVDGLYASTVVVLHVQSAEPFALELSGGFLQVNAGRLDDDVYFSEPETPHRHVLEVELLDWVQERGVREQGVPGAHNNYGISFYPFVSSFLRGSVMIHGNDTTLVRLVLDVPDSFRPLYAQSFVHYGGDRSPEPRHAQGIDRSRFIFTPRAAISSELDIDVALRFSAARLAELTAYPTAYYGLSLGGIAVATFIAVPGVVIAAVGTLWTFMLREWSKARVPRRHTFLSGVYFFAAALASGWATLWEVASTPWEVAAAAAIGILLLTFRQAWRRFDAHGELPRYLTRFWSWWVARK